MTDKRILEVLKSYGFRASKRGNSFYKKVKIKARRKTYTIRLSDHGHYKSVKKEILFNYLYSNQENLLHTLKKIVRKFKLEGAEICIY